MIQTWGWLHQNVKGFRFIFHPRKRERFQQRNIGVSTFVVLIFLGEGFFFFVKIFVGVCFFFWVGDVDVDVFFFATPIPMKTVIDFNNILC